MGDTRKIHIRGGYHIDNAPKDNYEYIWDWMVKIIHDKLFDLNPRIYIYRIKVGIEYDYKDESGTLEIDILCPKEVEAKKIMYTLEDLYNYTDDTTARLTIAESFIEWKDKSNA